MALNTLFQDFLSGTLSADLLTNATAMGSSALAAMQAVSNPNIIKVVINPYGLGGVPSEIVYVTVHTAAATTATVTRQQDTTTQSDHPAGTLWYAGPVASHWADWTAVLAGFMTQAIFTAKGQVLGASASGVAAAVPAGAQFGYALIADSAQTAGTRFAPPVLPYTSSTRPQGASTYVGMQIFETDTLHTLVCTAVGTPSTWQYLDVPPGTVLAYGGASAPVGYLAWDGSAVSRTTYAALFVALGTSYGAGDGSTTFNLGDGRERALVGHNNGGASPGRITGGVTRGATGGQQNTTQTTAHLPQHNHGGATTSDGGHVHTASTNTVAAHDHTGSTTGTGSHQHSIGLGGTGALIQFGYVSSTEWLTTLSSGAGTKVSGGAQGTGNHNHSISSDGSHSHTVTIVTAGAHTHSVSNDGSATPTPVTAVQPYVGVGFIVRI